jgi:hypothetical protein
METPMLRNKKTALLHVVLSTFLFTSLNAELFASEKLEMNEREDKPTLSTKQLGIHAAFKGIGKNYEGPGRELLKEIVNKGSLLKSCMGDVIRYTDDCLSYDLKMSYDLKDPSQLIQSCTGVGCFMTIKLIQTKRKLDDESVTYTFELASVLDVKEQIELEVNSIFDRSKSSVFTSQNRIYKILGQEDSFEVTDFKVNDLKMDGCGRYILKQIAKNGTVTDDTGTHVKITYQDNSVPILYHLSYKGPLFESWLKGEPVDFGRDGLVMTENKSTLYKYKLSHKDLTSTVVLKVTPVELDKPRSTPETVINTQGLQNSGYIDKRTLSKKLPPIEEDEEEDADDFKGPIKRPLRKTSLSGKK